MDRRGHEHSGSRHGFVEYLHPFGAEAVEPVGAEVRRRVARKRAAYRDSTWGDLGCWELTRRSTELNARSGCPQTWWESKTVIAVLGRSRMLRECLAARSDSQMISKSLFHTKYAVWMCAWCGARREACLARVMSCLGDVIVGASTGLSQKVFEVPRAGRPLATRRGLARACTASRAEPGGSARVR